MLCLRLISNFKELQEKQDKSWENYKGIYSNNTLNPGLSQTWNFLEKIFKEVSLDFPFNVIHIGVDERPSNSWKKSPAVNIYDSKEYKSLLSFL